MRLSIAMTVNQSDIDLNDGWKQNNSLTATMLVSDKMLTETATIKVNIHWPQQKTTAVLRLYNDA